MAKINKIKKNGTTIYPLTIPQAVIDPTTGESVDAALSGKQDKLVSGTNIKTINGASILTSGDVSVVNGVDGDSAYQIWLDAGNVGTQADFLASLQGNSGYSGAAGELEVVNNLTDGGPTSALSAEMGKDLNIKVSDNIAEIDGLHGEVGYVTKSVSVTRSGETVSFPYTCPANTKISLTLVADGVLNTGVNMSLYANSTSNMISSTFQVGVTKELTPTIAVTKLLLWIGAPAFSAAGTVYLTIGRVGNLTDRTTTAEGNIAELGQRVAKRLEGTSVSGGSVFAYSIKAGKSYIIHNTGANDCTFSSRNSSTGSNIETLATVKAGSYATVTATENAKYLRAAQETTFTIDCADSLDYAVTNIEEEIESVNGIKYEISVSSSSDGTSRCHFEVGHKYRISNEGETGVQLSTRTTASGSTVESIGFSYPGTDRTFEPTLEANYLRYGAACTLTITDISSLDGRIKILEDSQPDALYNKLEVSDTALYHKYEFIAGHKYLIKNEGVSAMFTTWNSSSGTDERVETIGSLPANGASFYFVPSLDAKYIKTGVATTFTIEDCSMVYSTVDKVNSSLIPMLTPPMVDLVVDYNMMDVSTDISGLNFSAVDGNGCYTIMEQVYSKFDSLVNDYPDYVTRVDAAEEAGLTYPEYTSLGGVASGDYLATPSYKVYMYKLVDVNPYVHRTAMHPKQKIFIVGATHGEETSGSVNTYLLAKRLCEAVDNNYFNLRSAYDFYIIPCLNGYGMYHNTRQNANLVDLNRNYPIRNWAERDSGQRTYTGPTAGSEFETQLVMAQTALINPVLAIDHHNYSALNRQHYTEVATYNLSRVVFQSLTDCSYAFIKNMPNYFGTSYQMFQHEGLSAPGYLSDINQGTTCLWWFQNGVACSATVEISQCINFENGQYHGMYVNRGPDTFSVGEYTLRNNIIRFCQWLGKYNQKERMLLAF